MWKLRNPFYRKNKIKHFNNLPWDLGGFRIDRHNNTISFGCGAESIQKDDLELWANTDVKFLEECIKELQTRLEKVNIIKESTARKLYRNIGRISSQEEALTVLNSIDKETLLKILGDDDLYK